jgi:hypothetical protein
VVGVPLSARYLVLFVGAEVTPDGKPEAVHFIGVQPPLVSTVAVYAVCTVPFGSVEVVMATPGADSADAATVITWPNDAIEGLAVTGSLLRPVPPTLRLAVDALPKKLIVPPVDPVIVGAKVTLRLTLCPAGRTSGRLKEDVVNWELPTAIAETVALVCPVFVTVTRKVSV